ncbi:hypothetical protein A3842_10995 [Paenibacillus sp. P3E]|uniref:hypothetical protein n=1 Tax=Paenibacillus sp. P3E TaxID=1349435 RepID=UPI00093BC0EA|nr:hypothetical protein [Paenibacillus sp. P3E]OKP81600.1 hypothetical protein A3842_10995 [Paenibacillus sp. P3E]
MNEFIVDTTCGRHFQWSAPDYESLLQSLLFRGYKAKFIMPLAEYNELTAFREEVERELKESA